MSESIERSMFSKNTEKTFIDKLLGRKESEEIKNLISKKNLTREELLRLNNLAASTHGKLLNLEPMDRYVILKYYNWIGQIMQICEGFFDHKDLMEKEKITNKEYEEITNKTALELEHVAKHMIDLYLNIGNTSLSVNGTFVHQAFTNKYEVNYGQQMLEADKKRKGLFEK